MTTAVGPPPNPKEERFLEWITLFWKMMRPILNNGILLAATHFADNETPAGTINGTDGTDGNAVFTLAHAPSPAGSLSLVKTDIGSGVSMIAGIHFNLATLTITYTAGNIPIAGMTHRASYRY